MTTNYPDCTTHPGRVAELVCLSNECPKRLTLQCTICINATCKKHNWKMMQEAIEEVFELCQNQQAREEKRKRQGTETKTEASSTKQEVEKLLSEFNRKLKIKEEDIMANVNLRAQGLLTKGNSTEELYVTVKNKINDFRKSNDRSFAALNGILNHIKPCIGDDDGMLVFTTEPSSKGGIKAPDVKEFENYLHTLLEGGSRLVRTNSHSSNSQVSPQKTGYTEKDMEELKQNYETQIGSLIEQVKSIPILKSRIDAISMKLQAKDEKLKKYEEGGNNLNVPQSVNPMKSSMVINEKVKESESRAKRVQKLVEVREKLKTMMYNYQLKNSAEEIQIHKLLRDQDAHCIETKNTYNEEATYLNMAMVVLVDELNYLQYTDNEEGDPYVEAQIIKRKSTDYKSTRSPIYGASERSSDPFLGGFSRPFGTTRSYFPSYY